MKEVEALSDAELRDELIKHGINTGPVTGTTRTIYEKKLAKLLASGGSSKAADTSKTKATPKTIAKTPKVTASTSRAARKTNRSESEDGSDDEIVSPRGLSAKKNSKPVTSTPTKDERTPSPVPSPPPPRGRGRPPKAAAANNIIPGLLTTIAPSVSAKTPSASIAKTEKKMLVIGSPASAAGDHPGHTPPRAKPIQRTPPRSTRTSTTITSSFLSPDTSYGGGASPKLSFQSSFNKGRSLADLGNTTDEDSEEGEESSRVVHNIHSTGQDRRSTLRRTMDSFMGNELRAGTKPGSNYELRRGTTTTNVARDPRSGRVTVSMKQKSVFGDISTIMIIVLSIFFALLAIAYVVASRPETVAGTVGVISTAARETVGFVYTYAIMPAIIIGVAAIVVVVAYFAHKRYQEAQAQEQTMFEELVEKIIDIVQNSSEEGEESISVPHVRDIMFPAAKRRAADVARWERAVSFIDANESRIATECRVIRGQECQVWRWLPYKKTGWQGNAYPSTSAKGASPARVSGQVPAEALTRCLKIRDVHEDREGKHPMEFVNYNGLKLAILEKIAPVRPVHMDFDKHSEDGVLYMKLSNLENAKDAFTALHTTWFNGHLVTVKYMRDARYNERFPITSDV